MPDDLAVDTSPDIDTSDATDSADPVADPAGAADDTPQYEFRRRGEARKMSGKDLASRYDDEYEHEFRGPKGAPVKAKWADIERHVQKSAGAENAIRAAQQERQALSQSREWGKKNTADYLQRYLGIADPEAWALDIARKRFEQETEIANLMQQDPIAAQNKLREIERARLERAQQWSQQEAEAQASQQQAAASRRENEQKMANELQRVGLKVSRETMAKAGAIIMQNRELDIDITYDQVAAELKKQLRAELLEAFDGEQDWIGLLGEKRREKLRAMELEAVKNAKKVAKATAPKAPVQSTPSRKAPADINSVRTKWGNSL